MIEVEGTFTTSDGSAVEFYVNSEGEATQWGQSVSKLGETVDLLGAIGAAVMEGNDGVNASV